MTTKQEKISGKSYAVQHPLELSDFFELSPSQRNEILLSAIIKTHAWHYSRNPSYRLTVDAKGIGTSIDLNDFSRILRPTSHVFKSYVDILGTPFPENDPFGFVDWMAGNLSIDLPEDQIKSFKPRYPNLESFLTAIEIIFSNLGFVIGTSSGTSGKATIMVRDTIAAQSAIEAYKLAVYALWGTKDEHQIIFIMPARTRIVMAWVARLATDRLGMGEQSHFTIPYHATPDQVRIRSGRLFKPGFRGFIEQHIYHPFMAWMNDHRVKDMYVNRTITLLEKYSDERKPVLLFGGWVQLDEICEGLRERGYGTGGKKLVLNPKSMIGTGGGLKEMYPLTPRQIQDRLEDIIINPEGQTIHHRDVYGMAEANWAAAQCAHGNYHIPPWIFSVVLDSEDEIINEVDATGLLAFFDPIAGGQLFPSFFKTADRVRLVNNTIQQHPDLNCPCGYQTAYITEGSIIRQDRLDEAGCAAQL
jgi:hypothetical protein